MNERMNEERPLTVPGIRGFSPIPRERKDAYSAASYSALYGINIEDAEELIDKLGSHEAIERAIYRMFSDDDTLKWRCLNPQKVEDQKREVIREEAEHKMEADRRERIEKAEKEEEEG